MPADRLETIHFPEADPDFQLPYSPAILAHSGKLLFIAGVTAAPVYHHHPHRDEEFESTPESAEGQARGALDNLKRTVESAGGSMQDIVMVTRYLTDFRDQDDINRVQAEYFGDHRPTSATVGVTRLVHPRLRFEIAAIAVVPD